MSSPPFRTRIRLPPVDETGVPRKRIKLHHPPTKTITPKRKERKAEHVGRVQIKATKTRAPTLPHALTTDHEITAVSPPPTSPCRGESPVTSSTTPPFHDTLMYSEMPQNSEGNDVPQACLDMPLLPGKFVEAVLDGYCGFDEIAEGLFVVNGWDSKRCEPTPHWYHLQRVKERNIAVCTCPQAQSHPNDKCLHVLYLEIEGFPDEKDIPYYNERLPIPFDIYPTINGNYLSTYSVPARSMPTVRNRAIVQFEGKKGISGTWSCTKDRSASGCYHINLTRQFLENKLGVVGAASNTTGGLQFDQSRIRSPRRKTAISYLQRPPPLWACVTDDEKSQNRFGFDESITHLPLGASDACTCNRQSQYNPDPFLNSTTTECIIYGLSAAHSATISLQKCQLCKRRDIGPDGRSLGVFNWNNMILVSEELLDDYTASFIASETPFTAYATVVSRRYQTRQSSRPFLHHKVFLEVWFAYIVLVDLDLRNKNTICPKCGPTPETTIWDGVTLAFDRRRLQASMEPPTTLSEHSVNRSNVKYITNQQCITTKEIRKLIRSVIASPVSSLPAELSESDDDTTDQPPETAQGAAKKARERKEEKLRKEREGNVARIVLHLQSISVGLAQLFNSWYGLAAIRARREVPAPYDRLFHQLAAEESVLQMMNRPALSDLLKFVSEPCRATLYNLLVIPSVYDVARHELETSGSLRADTIEAFRWLAHRGQEVLKSLLKNGVLPPACEGTFDFSAQSIEEKHWTLSGSRYTTKQLRYRPRYDNLRHDQSKEAEGGINKKRGICSKFFSQYKESSQTGGIMCIWCPHSICYGFHCIPKGEGRNDVFSALYTHWEKAPKRVIYDFACALGPYCLTREPEFFLDTEFMIDSFHAKDHTKCAPATFLATYSAANPELTSINTSAAECGNSGIRRIRKSVSYMSQDRAIIYTHVYLALWNRTCIQRL
ncbi:hypothetical protein DFP72DRAFT_1008043 [Ephemerocybe angulata]|uniref:SWIM-type domain-containing protein n=1 Tax=Ephemerocybe angulata TaxID=980116 RepID=A0A8H6I1X0_9AGAR|nr:hypothetical protein DFP72DRAFT_1008043 [Tulosesus angulatus]